jgi:Na/Pi-cotransporter
MTSNPFKGVLTGLGVTTVIQSSSATTVMVVSFVNAGLLTLTQAISVIMGANIGTTVTAWMVSWLGFKADISVLAIPLMALGFLFSNSKKNQRQNIGELIVGFCLLFLGLSFMKESVPDLNETPEVLEFVKTWSSHGFASVLIFLAFGTILTLVLQSSSATMAITLIMLSMGWIPFPMACAMVLGENIGTTTVYRQLERLVDEGCVKKYFMDGSSAAYFEYVDHADCGHEACFHCKCSKCGKLIHLHCHEMEAIQTHIFAHHGFQLDSVKTVLYGVCESCG